MTDLIIILSEYYPTHFVQHIKFILPQVQTYRKQTVTFHFYLFHLTVGPELVAGVGYSYSVIQNHAKVCFKNNKYDMSKNNI